MARIQNVIACFVLAGFVSGCGSAYSGLSNVSGVGAGQYRPAVVVEPGHEGRYEQVLAVCRGVAANRQATAAQKAQLESLTGAVAGAAEGAAAGAQFAGMLDSIGLESANVGQGALVGAAAGLVSGLASSFASGANETADETRRILLNCLRVTSRDGTLWQVVE